MKPIECSQWICHIFVLVTFWCRVFRFTTKIAMRHGAWLWFWMHCLRAAHMLMVTKSSHKQQKQADASPFLMSPTCNRMKGSRSAGTTNFHCSFANSNRISAGTGKILGCFKRRQNRVPLSLKGFCVLSWPWPRVKSSLQNFTCACGHKLNGQELNPVVMN